MTLPSFPARNRTLLLVLAAIGIFVLGFQAGHHFFGWPQTATALRRSHNLQTAVVDGDGSAAALTVALRSADVTPPGSSPQGKPP